MRSVLVLAFTLGVAQAALADPDPKTARLWKAKCASCHGEDGKALTDQGKKLAVADLTTKEWQQRFTDAQLKEATEVGLHRVSKAGVKQDMGGYKDKLRPEQIDALVGYMRALAH
jgi:mono/diheme cytochrome c family protein